MTTKRCHTPIGRDVGCRNGKRRERAGLGRRANRQSCCPRRAGGVGGRARSCTPGRACRSAWHPSSGDDRSRLGCVRTTGRAARLESSHTFCASPGRPAGPRSARASRRSLTGSAGKSRPGRCGGSTASRRRRARRQTLNAEVHRGPGDLGRPHHRERVVGRRELRRRYRQVYDPHRWRLARHDATTDASIPHGR